MLINACIMYNNNERLEFVAEKERMNGSKGNKCHQNENIIMPMVEPHNNMLCLDTKERRKKKEWHLMILLFHRFQFG